MSAKRVGKAWYQRLSLQYQLTAAVLLFILATVASRGTSITPIEEAIFRNTYNLPDFLHPVFYVITQFGSIYIFFFLVAMYFAKKKIHIVIRLLMTGSLAYLLSGFAKSLLGRGRPEEFFSDIAHLDTIHGPGFPSGHTALAVALALTIGHYLKRQYHWIPVIWIVLVGASRMYLGVHLPLDLIGGFAIGWFSYILFRHVRIYDIVRKRQNSRRAS